MGDHAQEAADGGGGVHEPGVGQQAIPPRLGRRVRGRHRLPGLHIHAAGLAAARPAPPEVGRSSVERGRNANHANSAGRGRGPAGAGRAGRAMQSGSDAPPGREAGGRPPRPGRAAVPRAVGRPGGALRRGRSGRLCAGACLHTLYSAEFYSLTRSFSYCYSGIDVIYLPIYLSPLTSRNRLESTWFSSS